MKLKRISSLLIVTLLMTTIVIGCGSEQSEDDTTDPITQTNRVAMVTDVGGVQDQSFNQAAWEGLQKAENDFGIDVAYRESNQEADYEPNIDDLVNAGYDFIWGVGFKMADAIQEASFNYPDQLFGVIDYSYGEETPENVIGVIFKEEEASYLVGLIAGEMTETNRIGFLAGMDSDVIRRFQYGFYAGVMDANPDAELLYQDANSFDDEALGKSIANQFYQQGADIIFHAAGATGTGMIEAAREQDRWAIGVDRDQNYLAPDHVLTSAMKGVDLAVYEVAEQLKDGTFEGAQTIVYGLAEGGVDIAPTSDKNVPEEILQRVEEAKQQIINGEIDVPATREEFEAR
ncbi:BMP family ABC transporter substrate-binding protein [Serpentinicella sp. ANB-PHB4]|uniref:BMP family lipoprotein n=1 Tax=Serpentinicella sp. ANB-PHB4 TaxID=3074076 RepID=UPI00286611BE|nr:BMP family ABC transporter substrate-binding protein [Serpentinicella sp. ANB-PHB4]MDR5658978.1 BMP family ABC transporter substrate-binding protein [Serpentinicella sp. ANB-PHB4]